ncbi:MAG: ABC transporter permease [Gammaproteobacteria bacterium]|nr:ABC transporter permease [Gammaproteobacteria bacterium]
MTRYLLRQITLLFFTLLALSLFTFCLSYWFAGSAVTNSSGIFPDDPSYSAIAAARGFDGGYFGQYIAYLRHLFAGDWGRSLLDGAPVFEQLIIRFGASLEIMLLALLVAWVPGVAFGVLAALKPGRSADNTILGMSISGYSIPVFWFAQLAILIVAVQWGLTPIAGQINPLFDIPAVTGSILIDIALAQPANPQAAYNSAFMHMIMPVTVLAIMPMMLLIRLTRNSMLDVLNKNYIVSSYAKGMSTRRVLWSHALPNAMQQVIRQLSNLISLLIANTFILEVIFSWPGIGNWLVRSIYERDYPVIQGGLLIIGSLILVTHVLLNLFHAWRYPQVRKDLYAAP